MRRKVSKKEPLCQVVPQSPENDAPEKYLTQAVRQLIAAAETPGNLLKFFTEALYTIHNNEGVDKDSFFGVSLMIEYLVTPWVENPKDPAGAMANGLSEMAFVADADGIHNGCGVLLISCGLEYEKGFMSRPYLERSLRILSAVCLMVPYVREYEHAKDQQKKKAA